MTLATVLILEITALFSLIMGAWPLVIACTLVAAISLFLKHGMLHIHKRM